MGREKGANRGKERETRKTEGTGRECVETPFFPSSNPTKLVTELVEPKCNKSKIVFTFHFETFHKMELEEVDAQMEKTMNLQVF